MNDIKQDDFSLLLSILNINKNSNTIFVNYSTKEQYYQIFQMFHKRFLDLSNQFKTINNERSHILDIMKLVQSKFNARLKSDNAVNNNNSTKEQYEQVFQMFHKQFLELSDKLKIISNERSQLMEIMCVSQKCMRKFKNNNNNSNNSFNNNDLDKLRILGLKELCKKLDLNTDNCYYRKDYIKLLKQYAITCKNNGKSLNIECPQTKIKTRYLNQFKVSGLKDLCIKLNIPITSNMRRQDYIDKLLKYNK